MSEVDHNRLLPTLQKQPPIGAYLAAVCAIGFAAVFIGLEKNLLNGDEVVYRLIADFVRRGESFLFLQFPGDTPYLNKPPVYFWLSALTANVIGPGWFAARFWSALFGFGCIVGTYHLGRKLRDCCVGLLAATLLAVNIHFTSVHGARNGVMDTAIVFCAVLSLILLLGDAPRTRRVAKWGMIALLCGLAGWFKPLNGLIVWAILLIAGLVQGRDDRVRLVRGLFAILPIVVLANAAWPLLQYLHYGDLFLKSFFGNELIGRNFRKLNPAHLQPWYYYVVNIGKSARVFWLFIPAMLVLVALAVRRRDAALATISAVPLIWVAVISAAPAKFLHYSFVLFPLIAIGMAAFYDLLGRSFVPENWRTPVCWATVSVIAVIGILSIQKLTSERRVPWQRGAPLGRLIASGDVALGTVGFTRAFSGFEAVPTGIIMRQIYQEYRDWTLLWFVAEHASSVEPLAPGAAERMWRAGCPMVLIVRWREEIFERLEAAAAQNSVIRLSKRYNKRSKVSVYGVNLTNRYKIRSGGLTARSSACRN